MDLNLTDEQQALAEAVRGLCERHSTPADVRALESDPKGFKDEVWTELSRMDLLGLMLSEAHGGAGRLPIETAVVCEELGRALCPSPYIESAVLVASLLGASLGERIASGEAIVVPAWHEPERTDTEDGIAVVAKGGRITGTKILVPFASSATSLLTLARDDDGVGVYLVDPSEVSMTHEGTLSSDARYQVSFDGAAGERVGSWADFDEAMTDALIAVAAYAIGGAAKAHEMSVEYAKEREQFGRPIGSFQAMAHPLSDLATEIGGSRTLVHQAAWARATGRDARALSRMAKYAGAETFRRAAKFGHQVFGGIGFTLDIDIQLYMRRAKQLHVLWYGPAVLEEAIAVAELDDEVPLVTGDPVASGAK